MKLSKLLAVALLIPSLALAWEPTKPVNVYVGFAPGSGNELSFRGIGSLVEKKTGANFIVTNQPGADGTLAMNQFVGRPNDGYHVYVPSHQGIWVTGDYFYKEVKKYALDDFDYVVSIAKSPLAIIVPGNSSIKNVPDLIKLVQSTKTPINVAAGSGAHKLAYNYMADRLKLNDQLIQTVNYKGPSQAGVAVGSNEVDFGIIPVAVARSLEEAGKIRVLAICSEQPLPALPNTPLMKDYVPGMNVYAAWGIILPRNTDPAIVKWYVDNFSQAIKSPEGQEFFKKNFMFSDSRELTPAGFKNSMMQLRRQWVPILDKLELK